MRFFLDGTEWNFPHIDSLSREEQLDALRERVAAEDRVIVDMLSDGESLDEKDLLTVPDGIDVDVITDTAWGVGLEILDEVKNSLTSIFKDLQTILDGSQIFEHTMLDGVRGQLDWIRDALNSFPDAYPEYDGALPDVEPLHEAIDVFERLLSDGRYAEANDWHEEEWKKDVLPPFLDRLNGLREWLELENSKDCGESEERKRR